MPLNFNESVFLIPTSETPKVEPENSVHDSLENSDHSKK